MWLRAHTARPEMMSADELRCIVTDVHLLAEALQNVPTFLRETGEPFTPETMRDIHIASYDTTSPSRAKKLFQLKSMLESALAETTQKLVELGDQPASNPRSAAP